MADPDAKLFPFSLSVLDTGIFGDGQALFIEDHCRTLQEAEVMAETRVLFGTKECEATIRRTGVFHVAGKIKTYYWNDENKIIYRLGC